MRTVRATIYLREQNQFVKVTGKFHQWAAAMEEGRDGFGNYTVAIIEAEDGRVFVALPEDVTFINGEESK